MTVEVGYVRARMSRLICDLGMHDCEDTAYYLAAGYNVLAVDANPDKCAPAEERFAAEVGAGRLRVVNVGLAAQRGEADFWVSSWTEWSSFDQANATKGGATAKAVRVPTLPLADILAGAEAPYFVKVDIEGNDSVCLRQLCETTEMPSYVSFEVTAQAPQDVALLVGAGFGRFRVVRQNDWRQMTPRNVLWYGWARQAIARLHHGSHLAYRRGPISGHRFVLGSSGPLPWTVPGRWWNATEAVGVLRHLQSVDDKLRAGGLGEWYDVHAAR